MSSTDPRRCTCRPVEGYENSYHSSACPMLTDPNWARKPKEKITVKSKRSIKDVVPHVVDGTTVATPAQLRAWLGDYTNALDAGVYTSVEEILEDLSDDAVKLLNGEKTL